MRSGSRATWLIGGGVVALLLLAGVDALRSSFNGTTGRATSTGTTATQPTGPGAPSPVEEFVAQAQVICGRATSELLRHGVPGNRLDQVAEWYQAAAQAAEESLARLRAIPRPEANSAPVNQFYTAAKREIDLLRQVAGAAQFHDRERAERLATRRLVATQQKGVVVARLSVHWHLDAEALNACPLNLPG